jgi:hypothetical protein
MLVLDHPCRHNRRGADVALDSGVDAVRRAARIDGPHTAIVKALRQAGASVLDLRSLGDGAPDLLVGFRGRDCLLEVKNGDKPPSARKLNAGQVEFVTLWRGHPVRVVHSPDEALKAILQ